MKRYFYTIALSICGLLAAASCDVMDTKPFTSFDDEAVWGSASTTDAFIVNSYGGTIDLLAPNGGGTQWMSKTPDGITVDQVYNTTDGVATELGLSNYSDYGFNRFSNLRACNLIIAKVAESETLTDKEKKEFTAEARLMRACVFFDQARKIGRFVPITKLLEPNDKEEFLTPITSSIAESYKYVMDDFKAAIEGLPETSAIERVNKYTAHLYRSRAALQAYAYTKDATYLDLVIESANAVINSGKYTLADNYGAMFNQDSKRDPEIIQARYYLAKDTKASGISETFEVLPFMSDADVFTCTGQHLVHTQTYSNWSYYWPTQDLVDQFLQIDENTGEAKNWWETSQYTENVIELDRSTMEEGCVGKAMKGTDPRNFPTAVDMVTGRTDYELFTHYGQLKDGCDRDLSDIMYENRDKRFDDIIIRDKTIFHDEFFGTNLMGSAFQGLRAKAEGGWFTTCTGYYYKKGVYTTGDCLYFDNQLDYHFVLARLGEAYMNLAEAQLLKKNIPAAVEALNATRVKHGGLPPSTASTEEEAWADYIRERRCEMAEEVTSDTYFSFLRWGKYGGYANYGRPAGDIIKDLDRPVYKICISQDRKKFSIGQVTLNNEWNRNFTVRRYLFPIPQSQIDTRSIYGINDTQNEGW